MIASSSIQEAIRRVTRLICDGTLSCLLASLCGIAAAQSASTQPMSPPAFSSEGAFEEEIVPKHYIDHPALNAFIDKVVSRYDFDKQVLQALFAQVDYSATAVRLVNPSPAKAIRNWRRYQTGYLNRTYIEAGVRFWLANEAALQRAFAEFGVPPEIIVGILGVETQYGRIMGNFRVLDVLTTLAFDYPDVANREARQKMFLQNLSDFLIWTRSHNLDPLSVKGSYAGAIGMPQFMPNSILHYAVSYDGNSFIDLRTSAADAIGSVANFLKSHGWETGRPVLWHIASDAGSQGIAAAAADGQVEPHWTLTQLFKAGLLLNEPQLELLPELNTPITVVDLPTPGQSTEYKLGLKNFYVLTRYNKSFFYATAAYQLGQQIKENLQNLKATDDDDTDDSTNTGFGAWLRHST